MATFFLIGGGPSAADLDTTKLGEGTRVAVNDAAFHKPADLFFSNDHNYARERLADILALGIPVHLSVFQRNHVQFAGQPVEIWRRTYSATPDRNAGCLSSGPYGTPGCSGYVALNLAAQLGASRIVLFGYDFQANYCYFFDGSPFPRKDISGVVRSFDAVAKHYRQRGIEVINANPDSAITGFPRMSHEDAIAWAAQPASSTTPARAITTTVGGLRSRKVFARAAGLSR
jgi:hypothetical protein